MSVGPRASAYNPSEVNPSKMKIMGSLPVNKKTIEKPLHLSDAYIGFVPPSTSISDKQLANRDVQLERYAYNNQELAYNLPLHIPDTHYSDHQRDRTHIYEPRRHDELREHEPGRQQVEPRRHDETSRQICEPRGHEPGRQQYEQRGHEPGRQQYGQRGHETGRQQVEQRGHDEPGRQQVEQRGHDEPRRKQYEQRGHDEPRRQQGELRRHEDSRRQPAQQRQHHNEARPHYKEHDR